MKKILRQKHCVRYFLLPLLLFLVWAAVPTSTQAASKPAQITSCKLSSASKIKVTVTLKNPKSVLGSKCYLFALPMSRTTIKTGDKPVQSRTKASKMTFSLSLNQKKASSRLYSAFVVAVKTEDGSYQAISGAKYLSNPSKAAKYTYKFPTASSKKGLQVSASMLEDAVELNVRHSVLNIVFTEMIATKAESNQATSISYKYHGKTYWFRRAVVENYDRQLVALKESNTVVSAVLLLGWRDDLKNLIYPSGRKKGHAFYAWNTKDSAPREQLQATLSFLAERYASSSTKYGRIANWIVGNEVNNYQVYNYAGKKTLTQYAQIYANAFRMTYNTVTSVYSKARVYISLDHLWNTNTVYGTFASRKMLDAFAKAISNQGYIQWNLAYHPYSSPLTEPKFWKNTNKQLTESLSTPVINMGNISLLTTYIREKYGSNTRIILSEQGYTSVQNGKSVQKSQTAAIAYSYYLAEADDMIDSFIMNRHVDHDVEVAQGLNLGLWTTSGGANPEWANQKKSSWEVFKYMDTNQSAKVTASSLKVIGIKDWSQVIDDFDASLYTKTSLDTVSAKQVKSYKKKASLTGSWKKYGAVSSSQKINGGFQVFRDNSRNRNSLWGFSQSFKKAVSFSKVSNFSTTLKVKGSTSSKVQVKLRFYSKDKILESSCIIPAGKTVKLTVPLSKWKYRKTVTKIQVALAPVGGGGWKNDASLEMTNSVRS